MDDSTTPPENPTVATVRQIQANQANALRSSGPKTDEGKLQSRRNALKHGLAGRGVVLPDEVEAAARTRQDEWRGSFELAGAADGFAFEQLCQESIRIDVLNRDLDEQ